MGVRATGLQSFKHVILFFFGMGTMMDFLKHEGTTDREEQIENVCKLFGGCVKNVSPISSNVCRNHAVLKRPLAQWVQVKSFNMCLLQFGIRNN